MRTSIWFRTEEKNPDKSDYYLSYRGWGMGGKSDYDHDYGYLYYDKKTDKWYEYDDCREYAIVYYWTDAKPDDWADQDPPSVKLQKLKEFPHNATLDDAWKKVQEAIDQYNMIKELVR